LVVTDVSGKPIGRLQGSHSPKMMTLEDGTDRLSQMLVTNYHYALCDIPEQQKTSSSPWCFQESECLHQWDQTF